MNVRFSPALVPFNHPPETLMRLFPPRSFACLVAALLAVAVKGTTPAADTGPIALLNVSYDPTRELYREINDAFAKQYQAEHGRTVSVKQSHAASGSQARAVIDGLDADVVTLAVWLQIFVQVQVVRA